MFDKLHLLSQVSQDIPDGDLGVRWRKHPYLRIVASGASGPAVFDWDERQRKDLEALWRDPTADGARERLARDLAAFCNKLSWRPDAELLENAEQCGEEYMLTLSAVPPELYLLPWEVIHVGASGKHLSDHATAQVRYTIPGLATRKVQPAPPTPGVLFAWSAAGGAVPHEEHAAAIRAAAEAGGVAFRELAEVSEASLQTALDAGPPSVLHLLCHGSPAAAGEPPVLTWGADNAPSTITATQLARLLHSHADAIRLVVLSACGRGDGQDDPMLMGSLAQELHKKGIPGVVASRYLLSARGSRVMTRALYDKMLREAWSLERALRHTREVLFRVDDDGVSYPGDAYGIQLYAYDTERFTSNDNVEAERPVLASYPFGTAARPVPASGPPAAEAALRMDVDPGLSSDQLTDKLRHVSEDGSLIAVPVGQGALIVRTTVDGAQRLRDAWRSKALQMALGVIVSELILTKGITQALPGTLSAAKDKASEASEASEATQAATRQVATAGEVVASGGQVGVTTGKPAATAGKAVSLAMIAVIGIVVAVAGGVVYRVARPSAAPESPSRSASIAQEPPIPAQIDPHLDQPAPASLASPATAAMGPDDIITTHLRQMLSDESDQVRLIAVQALSASRDPRAVTALVIALTKDEEPTIRREAALALGQLIDEKVADDLRKLGLHALDTAAENDPDLDVCVAAKSALHALARFSPKQTRPRTSAR
jgi:hypothetical protein